MSQVTAGRPKRAPTRGTSAIGYGFVVLSSAVLGTAGVLPFVMALYAVDQLVLAPLGLTPGDPTNDDGTAPVVIVGVLAPAVVVVIWACTTAVLVRRLLLLRNWAWSLAVVALATPSVVFVVARIS